MMTTIESRINQYIECSDSLFDLDSSNEYYIKENKIFFSKYEVEVPKINPFPMIYNFILTEIIPNYEQLFSCDFFDEDVEGNSSHEYYIRFNNNLSIEKRNQLHCNILKKIYAYCKESNFPLAFKEITIILTGNR